MQRGTFCLARHPCTLTSVQTDLCIFEEICQCLEERNAHNAEEAHLQQQEQVRGVQPTHIVAFVVWCKEDGAIWLRSFVAKSAYLRASHASLLFSIHQGTDRQAQSPLFVTLHVMPLV